MTPLEVLLSVAIQLWNPLQGAVDRSASTTDRVVVGPALYRRFQAEDRGGGSVWVGRFLLATHPVTNKQFLSFTNNHPKFQKGLTDTLFADGQYLSHWSSAKTFDPAIEAKPVVHVSWFAAKAYCASEGGRLPTELEWELAGAASEDELEARQNPAFREKILDWYSRPAGSPPNIGLTRPNLWGVYDLHGVVWEWVHDYDAVFVTADAREAGEKGMRFCGGGALDARDPSDAAAFMRIALRSSLKPHSTTSSLGFRCAWDLKNFTNPPKVGRENNK